MAASPTPGFGGEWGEGVEAGGNLGGSQPGRARFARDGTLLNLDGFAIKSEKLKISLGSGVKIRVL